MAASYPGTAKVFSTKIDGSSVVLAADPNSIQDEVLAIESTLGTNPQISTTPSSSGTFVSTSTTFSDVNARLANIEIGIVSDAHTQYVKNTGAGVIVISSGTSKGLVVRGNASQSANLQEWQNSSSTVLAYVTPAGGIVDTKLTVDLNNLYVLDYVFG